MLYTICRLVAALIESNENDDSRIGGIFGPAMHSSTAQEGSGTNQPRRGWTPWWKRPTRGRDIDRGEDYVSTYSLEVTSRVNGKVHPKIRKVKISWENSFHKMRVIE